MPPTSPRPPLTNVQRELLTLFALDVPDQDLVELRRLLARFFAERATSGMDQIARERGLTDDDFRRWADGHERSRADRP